MTWGDIIVVTWPFLAQYCDEAWAILSHEIVEHGADTFGINTTKLHADLNALT